MAFGKGFFKDLFWTTKDEDEDFFAEYEVDVEAEAESLTWTWDTLIKDRHLLKLSDDNQREKYIRSLVEQVKNASEQMDALSAEYNSVTATLKDMDEIEALPGAQLSDLRGAAERLIGIEEERNDYLQTKSSMTDAQFKSMEKFSGNMPKAYEDIKAAEEQKVKIKSDLKRLEEEKLAYSYRHAELKNEIQNSRGIMAVCAFAAVLCVIMLAVLQFGFEMETGIGYIITVLAAAVAGTVIYTRYQDSTRDIKKISKSINRIILLQNTVKIRYVNNKNLLDYLYLKYNTSSAKELHKIWEQYEEEREKRDQFAENERQLSLVQQEFVKKLRQYHVEDVFMWLHNPGAVMDHKEMVEVRHAHILQRQKLRSQLDYNKRLAKEAEQELKQLVEEYPKYGSEVMDMLERYS